MTATGGIETRSFRFDVYADEEIIDVAGGIASEFLTGCAVTLRQVKAQYHRRWEELSADRFSMCLSSNFLTYLVDGRMPDTKVIVGDEEFDLRSHFARLFSHEDLHLFPRSPRGDVYEFRCDVSRVRTRQNHLRDTRSCFLLTTVCLELVVR